MRNCRLFMFALSVIACVDVVHSAEVVEEDANEAPSVTLEEAIISAYNGNIGWLIGKIDKGKADEQLQQAKMAFLPDVHATMTLSRSRTDDTRIHSGQNSRTTYNTDNGGNRTSVKDIEQIPYSELRTMPDRNTGTGFRVDIRQNLFNGFSTLNTVHAAEHTSDAAFHNLRMVEQKLIVDVFEEYADVWFCITKVSAYKKMEENMQKLLASQNSCLEVGTVTPAEVADASAKYQNAMYSRINAETELFSAESKFEKLTGLKAGKHITLPEIKLNLPKTLKILFAETMKSNSKILNTRLEAQAAEKELDVAKGALSPRADLILSAGRDLETHDERLQNNSKNSYRASLEVTVPIFEKSNGGNSYSRIAIVGKEAKKARLKAEDAVLEAKEGCVVNWNNYITANAMIRSSRSAVQSAELSNESNIEEVNMGVKSNTDIWQKENTLLEARINLAKSKKEKIVSGIKIMALTGNLNMRSVLESVKSAKPAAGVKVTRQPQQQPKK
ncbi:hypothetical protein FACS189449_05520 [Alphaproteobacteria bacterium]|nr:hypothetical protein FACS189449_05520 [Alphaproteobacteria bacterium]